MEERSFDPTGNRTQGRSSASPNDGGPLSAGSATGASVQGRGRAPDALPTVSLPKGGGAIRGMGEKFTVNAATGTGTFTVPIASSPGRAGFTPQLALSYDSGAGNGAFGFGWSLGLAAITRKTDKGLPCYRDSDESDVFILSGAEDLVPVCDSSGTRIHWLRTVHGASYDVCPYQPRIESLFARIERWTRTDTGISHWRSISRDNVTTLYGTGPDSRVADPNDPTRIFSYLISQTFDDLGNITIFDYVGEDGSGVDTVQSHEANRHASERAAQRYPKRIRYAATRPYFPDWSLDGSETPLPTDWHFEIVFDYGDHAPDSPEPVPDRAWPVRIDPFSAYRSGFEVRTYRRCARVLHFHHFKDEAGVGNSCLVRSTDLRYSDQDVPTDPRNPAYSFLTSITQAGYRRAASGYRRRSLPPLELEYSQSHIQDEVLTVDADSLANLPEGLAGSRYQLVDLDGEGLPGILTKWSGGWGYKRNYSPFNEQGPSGVRVASARFGTLEIVGALPSGLPKDASARFVDLAGDGRLDLAAFDGGIPGYFQRTDEATWEPFQTFAGLPRIDWSDPNLRLVDLTGDGLADVMLAQDQTLTFYPSLGRQGFGEAQRAFTPSDEEHGPRLVFADGTQTVFLADMSGDGLPDIVRIRNGEVCYWPSLGYGHFGAKVTMDDPPLFAELEQFDARRVRLADIDGSGTTDIVYVGARGVMVCLNRSGNSFAAPHRLAAVPTLDNLADVQVADLLGTGTACLVWSSPLAADDRAPFHYVDLMSGGKPHLLTTIRNNLGAETRLRYAPSTHFYLADKTAGRPWLTRLPYPVQVLVRVETYDWVGRSRSVTRYAYHHGHFDGWEREFRGFGMVEQWDTDEHSSNTGFPETDAVNWAQASWTPPMLTRTWFHTGAALRGVVSRQFEQEYWIEPKLRPATRIADREAMLLNDSVLPIGATADEVREAYRALKGLVLRTEIYSEDGSPEATNPYSLTEQNYGIHLLQPKSNNRHAVFFAYPRETLTFDYERRPDDPRVTHDVVLEVDDFGNVRRKVSVAYPRRQGYPDPEPTLSAAFQAMLAHDQTRLHIACTDARYTNDLADSSTPSDIHRAPLNCESVTAELTGFSPAAHRSGVTNLFTFEELDAQWQVVADGSHDVSYEQVPAADVDGAITPPTAAARRVVGRSRTLYRSGDLTRILPLGQVEPQALPGRLYRLAFSPSWLSEIFGSPVSDATLLEGGYQHLPDSADWWIPSPQAFYSSGDADTPVQELAEARLHFYSRCRAVDPFGAISRVVYDSYDLLPAKVVDALGNATMAENNYRVMEPFRTTDPNGNRVEVAFDGLGLVVGNAVMGKVSESVGDDLLSFEPDLDETTLLAYLANPISNPGSILGNASSRILYDLFAYYRTRDSAHPDPPVVSILSRETHASALAANEATRYVCTFAYGDGFAREIQRKSQAAPGPTPNLGTYANPRWIGSGWTIYNNKGKAVRKYEPFFSATHQFEFASTVGVSSVLFYDPAGRVIATLHPDNSWEKVVFDNWRQETWDPNDTVLVSDPRLDGDVGDYFHRLFDNEGTAFVSWYNQRIQGTFGDTPEVRAAEQAAAQKAAAHAATPAVTHTDARGRICLNVSDNGDHGRYPTRTALDTEGKPLAVIDALGRRVFEYCIRQPQNDGTYRFVAGHDLAGNEIYHNGMDGGERKSLPNIVGKVLRARDARGHQFRFRYDLLLRPTHRWLRIDGGNELLVERSLYGEGLSDRNLCTRLFQQYDEAGIAVNERYDFKGNLVASSRQIVKGYQQSTDWSALADISDPGAAYAVAATQLVDGDRFSSTTSYDALNRPIQLVTPHREGTPTNAVRPHYNEAGLIERVAVWTQLQQAPITLLDPSTADLHPVNGIQYNARAQRTMLALGNGTVTASEYDPQTIRLSHLTTTRPSSFDLNQRAVQDLAYVYDPVGNITAIRDAADTQNVVYFLNRRVEPSNDYAYDALYRLTAATGREHLGQTVGALSAPTQPGSSDSPWTGLLQPSDGNAMGTYTESYGYDAVGNLTSMLHLASSGSWTRRYLYSEPSQVTSTETSNRLSATSLPGDPVGGPYAATYAYDSHGNTVRMPHLPEIRWDEQDRLMSTTRQTVSNGVPETTYYSYDANGQRLRKATDRQAAANQLATRRAERLYLGPIEIYREFAGDGSTLTLERETLHIMAESTRVALIETRTAGTDAGVAQLSRFQYGNHLGSACLELDGQALIISYEEYFPFGTASYQAVRNQTETPKRYRFTGKERDDESDLYYHGARYYAPWLGRWTSCDPKGLVDGLNLYTYALDNPINKVDETGLDSRDPDPKGEPSGSVSELTALHQDIRDQKSKFKVDAMAFGWTDIVEWKTDPEYLTKFKERFVYEERDVIQAAAEKFDIPPVLLAGVAYTEIGGKDPTKPWVYRWRKWVPFTEDKDKTSLGNLAMQPRRAAASLGYDPKALTDDQRDEVIKSLNDPVESIFVAAKHLSDLRDVDFKGTAAKDLTPAQIAVIGSRYNWGPEIKFEDLEKDLSYGKSIVKRLDRLNWLLVNEPAAVEWSPIENNITKPLSNAYWQWEQNLEQGFLNAMSF